MSMVAGLGYSAQIQVALVEDAELDSRRFDSVYSSSELLYQAFRCISNRRNIKRRRFAYECRLVQDDDIACLFYAVSASSAGVARERAGRWRSRPLWWHRAGYEDAAPDRNGTNNAGEGCRSVVRRSGTGMGWDEGSERRIVLRVSWSGRDATGGAIHRRSRFSLAHARAIPPAARTGCQRWRTGASALLSVFMILGSGAAINKKASGGGR